MVGVRTRLSNRVAVGPLPWCGSASPSVVSATSISPFNCITRIAKSGGKREEGLFSLLFARLAKSGG